MAPAVPSGLLESVIMKLRGMSYRCPFIIKVRGVGSVEGAGTGSSNGRGAGIGSRNGATDPRGSFGSARKPGAERKHVAKIEVISVKILDRSMRTPFAAGGSVA